MLRVAGEKAAAAGVALRPLNAIQHCRPRQPVRRRVRLRLVPIRHARHGDRGGQPGGESLGTPFGCCGRAAFSCYTSTAAGTICGREPAGAGSSPTCGTRSAADPTPAIGTCTTTPVKPAGRCISSRPRRSSQLAALRRIRNRRNPAGRPGRRRPVAALAVVLRACAGLWIPDRGPQAGLTVRLCRGLSGRQPDHRADSAGEPARPHLR